MQVFLSQLVLGLVNGSFYAMLSLGLAVIFGLLGIVNFCLLYTSPSPRDRTRSRMPSSA